MSREAPGWIDKVQFIKYFYFSDCGGSLMLYIETLKTPINNLVWALLSFGVDDLVRSIFRPAGIRSARHGRKGKRTGKGPGGLPEPSDLVATHVPLSDEAPHRPVGDGVRWLWNLDGYGQRALYYWQVVDLTTDFFYDWASALVESPGSDCTTIAHLKRKGGPYFTTAQGQWNTPRLGELISFQGFDPNQQFSYGLPEGEFLCTFNVDYRFNEPGTCQAQAQLSFIGTGVSEQDYTALTQVWYQGGGNFLCMLTVRGPGSITPYVRSPGGHLDWYEPRINIMQIAD